MNNSNIFLTGGPLGPGKPLAPWGPGNPWKDDDKQDNESTSQYDTSSDTNVCVGSHHPSILWWKQSTHPLSQRTRGAITSRGSLRHLSLIQSTHGLAG